LALALAGCASPTVSGTAGTATSATGSGATTPGTTTSGTTTSGTQGTLAGDVVAAPTCPVEPVDDPCPPRAVPDREVQIHGENGAVVATVTTDSTGHFSVALTPGTYSVVVPGKPGQVAMRQVKDVKASVTAGQVTTVRVELDTGIR
jgi:hypothetical protein